MIKVTHVLCVLFFSITISAQNLESRLYAYLDLVQTLSSSEVIDENKIKLYLDSAKFEIEASNNEFLYGDFYFEKSKIYDRKNDFDSEIIALEEGIQKLGPYQDSLILINLKYELANAYYLQEKFTQSLTMYLGLISCIEKRSSNHKDLGDSLATKNIKASCLRIVGNIYFILYAEKKAIAYSTKAANLFAELGNQEMQRSSYFSIAYGYIERDELEKSKKYIDAGFEIEAKNALDVEIADHYIVYCYYLIKSGKLDSVNYYLEKSISVYQKYGDSQGIMMAKVYNGELCLSKGKYKEAALLLETALAYLQKSNMIRILAKSKILLSKVYSKLGHYKKAYQYATLSLNTQNEMLKKAEDLFSYEYENRVEDNRVQYIDSLKLISDNYKIKQIESKLIQKSIYNKFLWYTLVFFLILTSALFYLLKRNKTINTDLNQSLSENKFLFQEVHHRVKNNFQIISSLMNLQRMNSTDRVSNRMLKETQQRILSMALVHELLYKSDKIDEINADEYINDLIQTIVNMYDDQKLNIQFSVNTNNIILKLEQAIPMGLILNEAVTNSIKYAFPGHSKGFISISLEKLNSNESVLKIKDDGCGMNYEEELGKNTLGLELIEVLTEQLNGEKKFINNGGTQLEILIRNQYLN